MPLNVVLQIEFIVIERKKQGFSCRMMAAVFHAIFVNIRRARSAYGLKKTANLSTPVFGNNIQ
jgi:hypothetical protein